MATVVSDWLRKAMQNAWHNNAMQEGSRHAAMSQAAAMQSPFEGLRVSAYDPYAAEAFNDEGGIKHPRFPMQDMLHFTVVTVENGFIIEMREPGSPGQEIKRTSHVVTEKESIGEKLQALLVSSKLMAKR